MRFQKLSYTYNVFQMDTETEDVIMNSIDGTLITLNHVESSLKIRFEDYNRHEPWSNSKKQNTHHLFFFSRLRIVALLAIDFDDENS